MPLGEFVNETIAILRSSPQANRLNDGSLALAAKDEHSTDFATLSDQYREQLFRLLIA